MKLKYIRDYGLFIPKLENRPMGVNLPLIDYATGDFLPKEQQILEVNDKEGAALIRSGNFVEIIEEVIPVSKKKKEVLTPIEETKEVENNG